MSHVQAWLDRFGEAVALGHGEKVSALFLDGGFWRDYLAFSWDLVTTEGADKIGGFAGTFGQGARASNWTFQGGAEDTEGFVSFDTQLGRCRGYIRLEGDKCLSLLTTLEEIKGHEEAVGTRRVSGVVDGTDGRNWTDIKTDECESFANGTQPYVLIVGGGQGGLALGARLRMLNVPFLIIDKKPRVGDQWRSRYKSLTLHDPVWFDHMPYIPFPDFWPVFTPKDKMGDWLESYADALDLNVWTSTECVAASFDEASQTWQVKLNRDGQEIDLRPTQLVMAVGNAGFPQVPDFRGKDDFSGVQMHSSAFPGGEGLAGKKVVVVGANNSAHDICADLVENGAHPVMIQRSSTLIVRQSNLCEQMLKPLYSEEAVAEGIDTETADLIGASVPFRMQEVGAKEVWDQIREMEQPFYQRLTDAGFKLDFGDDGTGLAMKYNRTASGYYIDVGASEMIADGRIALRSGVTIETLTGKGVMLDSGEELEADMIIYATGYGTMEEWVARLISPEVANKVGKCWGYGSGVKGDPGPWIGELRNMWKPTAQDGLWFMGGNLSQTRYYSKYLGLQLKARFEALPLPASRVAA